MKTVILIKSRKDYTDKLGRTFHWNGTKYEYVKKGKTPDAAIGPQKRAAHSKYTAMRQAVAQTKKREISIPNNKVKPKSPSAISGIMNSTAQKAVQYLNGVDYLSHIDYTRDKKARPEFLVVETLASEAEALATFTHLGLPASFSLEQAKEGKKKVNVYKWKISSKF